MHAGGLANDGEGSNAYIRGSNHVYAILVGLFSAITGGISYCLTRAGAKASDQPVYDHYLLVKYYPAMDEILLNEG